ncbi:deoxyguanosinetriphosphate triphosphohydrolase [Candidatus Peregrinibacteria bacterium]|nr:deoxyguanosinetriphosphate triphosphohydrolase [Candidatus Peregrinibacteria bacterium]
MIFTREKLEELEKQSLMPYAILSKESIGRKYKEPEDEYRLCFQKDKERVIHSKAFRRLDKKTQVFISGTGDHYRTRLTHTLEVAQIARSIARMLGLNEDLCEVIALSHDLGHPPFGHTGEEALNEVMQEFGLHFEHNEQSKRVVDTLEKSHPKYNGLNLSLEVIAGLLKHQTAFDQANVNFEVSPHLEAQVVNMADEIAYTNHDIDDGLRSGIINLDDLKSFDLWKEAETFAYSKHGHNLSEKVYISRIVSSIIKLMIKDLCEVCEHNIKKFGINSISDVKSAKLKIVTFSSRMQHLIKEIREFLYENFYYSPDIQEFTQKGKRKIIELFGFFVDSPKSLPLQWTKDEETPILIKDYIAGMTDNYLISEYMRLINK